MKKTLLIILFLLCTQVVLSQSKKTLYVDENYKAINFSEYTKKLNSKLFDIVIASNDTATFKKLRFGEFYGKLTPKIKGQLTKLLNKRYKIDTTKVWQIHYVDTIPNINKMPKESGIEFLDSLNNPTGIFLTTKKYKTDSKNYPYRKHKHIQSANDYIKRIERERKKIKKKKVSLIHFYKHNKGFPIEILNDLGYYKDYQNLIERIFNDKMKKFSVILLHPNGEFYVSKYHYKNLDKEKKLCRKSFFDKQKKKWLNKLEKLND